jgi:hypothetical protein
MQLSQIYLQVSARLNEAGAPAFYPVPEIIAAINEGQRVFTFLTLALETTVTWTPAVNTPFFHMLPLYPDFIVPLRIATASGSKVRPARLSELWSLDSQWPASPGSPMRYAAMGADLVALYQQPAAATPLILTYARAPVALAADVDIPEIPPEYHPQLVNYGIYHMRQVEGANGLAAALPLLADYLAAATEYGNYMRARNIGSGYDALPIELALYDKSRLLGVVKPTGGKAAA